MGEANRTLRCAIYTRKSTEEGLEQEFNTLQAQREAGEAYILSQSREGWSVLPQRYDDGGLVGVPCGRPERARVSAPLWLVDFMTWPEFKKHADEVYGREMKQYRSSCFVEFLPPPIIYKGNGNFGNNYELFRVLAAYHEKGSAAVLVRGRTLSPNVHAVVRTAENWSTENGSKGTGKERQRTPKGALGSIIVRRKRKFQR